MRRALAFSLLLALSACGDNETGEYRGSRTLAMPDVTILLPLPESLDAPVLAKLDATDDAILPLNLVTPLAVASEVGTKVGYGVAYDDFHVVAVRFDPCPRDQFTVSPGSCSADEDARLRLVLEPLAETDAGITTNDVALHAFYVVPNADIPTVVGELRGLAELQNAPLDAPLQVSPALVADPTGAYAQHLRDFVLRYARSENLAQLTVAGQDRFSGAFEWLFGGYILRDGQWQLITIPACNTERQLLRLGGGDTAYDAMPAVDAPSGVGLAMNGALFGVATPEERHNALEALAEIENPVRHDTNDQQCAVCHISTFLSTYRGMETMEDLTALARRFPTMRNVSVDFMDNIAQQDARVVRNLGWVGTFPAISRRVANETANILDEIERRVPGSSPH